MTTGYQIKEQDKLYFITLRVVNWIDIFTRECYKEVIVENLKYCQEQKELEIYAWVIMSNHLHLIVNSGKNNLSGTLRDFKSYTSKIILKMIQSPYESRQDWMLYLFKRAAAQHKRNSEYQFWAQNNHAEIIFSNKFIEQKLRYIHLNPVRAGVVTKPEEYKYSSAWDYYNDADGLLKVNRLILMGKI